MRVEPINCFRPVPERAGRFSAPPYDVLDDAQARAYVAERPDSFMAIDRPETAFDSEHDPYAPEVYQYAVKLLNDRVKDGTLVRDERECLYVYRLEANGHSQTGIVAAVSVDDYLEGTVRRHEQVREEKVRDRIAHISTVTAQTGPVLVTYPDFPAISFLVGLVCTGEPLYDFVAEDGVRHTVWRIAREVAVESICETFKRSPVYRIGGDEFVVTLSGADFENRVSLLEAFRTENEKRQKNGGVIIACGMAEYNPGSDESIASVFDRADNSMYLDKDVIKAVNPGDAAHS